MRLNKVSPSSITFEVINYKGHINSESSEKKPNSVKRLSDGEIFSIGDYVTNGTKMRGHIEEFELTIGDGSEELCMFVLTDWSGVSMSFDDIFKTSEIFKYGDLVNFSILQTDSFDKNIKNEYKATAKVIGVHFYNKKVKYDLEIPIADENPTRIYNIDSYFVEAIKTEKR